MLFVDDKVLRHLRIVSSSTRLHTGQGLCGGVFSGHSLRAGFVTSALDAGEDPLKVMKQSRHVKVDTLKGYDQRENDFDDHAGGGLL